MTVKQYQEQFGAPTEFVALRMKRKKIALDLDLGQYAKPVTKSANSCSNTIAISKKFDLYSTGKVVCQICGESFNHLEYHLIGTHSVSPDYYKKCLGKDTPLCGSKSKNRHRKVIIDAGIRNPEYKRKRTEQINTKEAHEKSAKSVKEFYNTPEGKEKQAAKTANNPF